MYYVNRDGIGDLCKYLAPARLCYMHRLISQKVAILGASDKEDRYSNKALRMLKEYGHTVFPIHPRLKEIEGVNCYPSLEALAVSQNDIDTLTVYVGPKISSNMDNNIIALNPKRVIFNPGAENLELQKKLQSEGIEIVEGCTLVMLRTDQF